MIDALGASVSGRPAARATQQRSGPAHPSPLFTAAHHLGRADAALNSSDNNHISFP